MSIAGYNSRFTTLNSTTSANGTVPILVAPAGGAKLISAFAFAGATLAAGSANHFNLTLINGGTVGTATTAITSALGGTAAGGTAPGWTLGKKETFAITSGSEKLAAGEVLRVEYKEVGTVAVADWTVVAEWTQGI